MTFRIADFPEPIDLTWGDRVSWDDAHYHYVGDI